MVFQVGNPGGGYRKPVQDALNMEIAALAEGRIDPVPRNSLRMACRQQLMKAAKGSLASLAWITERLEGKAKTIVGGDVENPIGFALVDGMGPADRIRAALERMTPVLVEAVVEPVEAVAED